MKNRGKPFCPAAATASLFSFSLSPPFTSFLLRFFSFLPFVRNLDALSVSPHFRGQKRFKDRIQLVLVSACAKGGRDRELLGRLLQFKNAGDNVENTNFKFHIRNIASK